MQAAGGKQTQVLSRPVRPDDADGNRHMEYVNDHGTYADVPFAEIATAFEADYPRLLAYCEQRRKASFASEAEAERLSQSGE